MVYYAQFWERRCRTVTVCRYQRRIPLYSGSVPGAHSASRWQHSFVMTHTHWWPAPPPATRTIVANRPTCTVRSPFAINQHAVRGRGTAMCLLRDGAR